MRDASSSPDRMTHASREEMISALFANMVVQQANMALIFLGKVPHPETGERIRDVEAAQMFIDQLEMLEAKTKGNLDKREEGLLKQSLTAVRMAFVEAVEQPPAPDKTKEPTGATGAPGGTAQTSTAGETQQQPAVEASAPVEEPESRKKFTKKY